MYDHRPIESLSSPEFIRRGMISVVAIVRVPIGFWIVSHGKDVSDVVILVLGQNCFNIFVVLYLLLG